MELSQEIMSTIVDAATGDVLTGVWFLMGAALVFWMQAGFAMVEAGFTRAKNAGNIIMKNLMDFCIGTVVFILIGYSLLLGTDVGGFIGMMHLTGRVLYLIWYSVRPQQPSYPVPWQSGPSFHPTVSILQ